MINVALLAALFTLELLIATTFLDGAVLSGSPGIAGQIGVWGAWILRAIVGFAVAFTAFLGLRGRSQLLPLLAAAASSGVRWRWLVLHVGFTGVFGILSSQLYGNARPSYPDLVALSWILSGSAAIATACVGLLSAESWRMLRVCTGNTWIYAATVSLLAVALVRISQSLWQSTAELTFQLVAILVRPLVPDLVVQPERLRLSTANFGVIIDQSCSGLEGAGLMLVFGAVWLFLYRGEFRFPRALLLLPAGILTLYFLNAVRIAALLTIGNAGAPGIAAGGFHSQAGWIAFNGVAFAMTVFVPKMRWFSLRTEAPPARCAGNPTAVFLLPFLAILASGMFSRASSAGFEWLYPLRLLAALAALWVFRHALRKQDWRFGWMGPAAGIAVFGLWIGIDQWNQIPAAAMPAPLLGAQPWLRNAWIAFRLLATVLTVPIAEELAFRGFLMRRFTAAAFEQVPLREASWLGVVLSSVAFGLLHGDRWLAGILAGTLFAWVARRTNRIGECVAAHATANALLGALVLSQRAWQYW